MTSFENNAPVWLHSLGSKYDGKRFRAVVVGISVEGDIAYPAHYIVRLLDKFDPTHPFDYITITGACIEPRDV